MEKFVLLLDTPAIKKFVFATDKMREIAGGSGLLDNLNREKTPEILSSSLSKIDEVYCNGGTDQFIVTSTQNDLDACLKKLQKTYLEATFGNAQVVYGYNGRVFQVLPDHRP